MKKIKLFLKQAKNNTKLIFKALRKYLKDFHLQLENEKLEKENKILKDRNIFLVEQNNKKRDKIIKLERKGDNNE